MLAATALSLCLVAEARRVLRDRAEERRGVRRYAAYHPREPDRALVIVAIEDEPSPTARSATEWRTPPTLRAQEPAR